MDIDRAFIERTDFPAIRRGYDPSAVDRHLREVADTVEELRDLLAELRRSSRTEPSLSGAAAEQVRVILEAAERSAADLQYRAGERAREVAERTDAETETRVARVEHATDDMLGRAEALEAELRSLGEKVRAADDMVTDLHGRAGPLRGELESLRTAVGGLRGAASASEFDTGESDRLADEDTETYEAVRVDLPDAEVLGLEPLEADPESAREAGLSDELASGYGEPGAAAADPLLRGETLPAADEAAVPEPRPAEARDEPVSSGVGSGQPPEPRGAEEEIVPEATGGEGLEPAAISPAEPEAAEAPSRPAGPGDEGARLVALNMALNGTPREETDRYLAENFDVSDRSAVLDDVYSRVGGS